MNILEKLRSETDPEDGLLWTWQFQLAVRIAQILEEKNITQKEFAERTGLTDAQVSAMLHSSSNPTLSTLAKIASRMSTELLVWTDIDVQSEETQVDAQLPNDVPKTKNGSSRIPKILPKKKL
ncbi:MAG: helix-turn-helix domain-containing protein [bacterium]|nr:helix-turn-helix domain-containing protein [bacterium]